MINQVTLVKKNSNNDNLLFIGSITDINKNDSWEIVLQINNKEVIVS